MPNDTSNQCGCFWLWISWWLSGFAHGAADCQVQGCGPPCFLAVQASGLHAPDRTLHLFVRAAADRIRLLRCHRASSLSLLAIVSGNFFVSGSTLRAKGLSARLRVLSVE